MTNDLCIENRLANGRSFERPYLYTCARFYGNFTKGNSSLSATLSGYTPTFPIYR